MIRHKSAALALLACSFAQFAVAAGPASSLRTVAEQSGDRRTGRYEEVERLCPAFQKQWPQQVRCFEFGRTPEGRPMLALVASADGTLDAASAHRAGRPVALMQGGIHSGEIDGKDAGFLALRQMLDGSLAKDALKNVTLVFVPVFNIDGHERFGRWNRPNQVGPEEMGWRVTAQNLNLNRDYLKAEAPEMHAMLRLLGEWDPILYVDLHVTNGAKFEHDISYSVAPTLNGHAPIRQAAVEVRDELMKRAAAKGSLPLDFYPSFIKDDDPSTGFAVSVGPKRFSQAYWAGRNRIGVLVETHSWKDYPTRVRITHHTIISLMEMAARDGKKWLAAARAADAEAAKIGGSTVALTYTNTPHVRTIEFRGYEYERRPSAISGTLMTRYNDKKPQIWRIPLYDEVKPDITVSAPLGGYVVPASHARMVGDKLTLHGIEFRTLTQPLRSEVEVFRATKAAPAAATFEGRSVFSVEGDWSKETREMTAGSLFVPIAQAKSEILMSLLEPRDPDSMVSWGFFAAAFERKEYMEAYVAEAVGEQMLKKDPALRREFQQRLEDPKFASDPSARLDFFYRRHSSWDERYNLYPVFRVDAEPR
ncbi:M14 family metallopeptidase [Steroidobacter sp. S1-65]|uniref:M14 family metallopeptidase n=1 Tax=Steroidobacter gossypii TaxID=2805490 RepID=A0ABS1WU35_9GAMM|nr:M14 family metallopeptidase [Steroidobacter gossypii]MBM0104462.1 M14 family metallopeptidase [Steroidobacter gossypii]